jgi:hypothetical protein
MPESGMIVKRLSRAPVIGDSRNMSAEPPASGFFNAAVADPRRPFQRTAPLAKLIL